MFHPTSVIGAVVALSAALAFTSMDGPRAREISKTPTCLDGRATFDNLTEDEADLICRGIAAARDVLAHCGFTDVPRITVEAASSLIDGEGFDRRGEYLPASRRLRIRPLAEFIATTPPSIAGVPAPHSVLYASVAAHEMSHAILAESAIGPDLPPTAHEYVAYTIQIATLPEEIRAAIDAKYPEPALVDLFVFSPFLLYGDPERFAVAAWRHFGEPDNGCGMIHRILAGKVRFPPPTD